MFEAGDKVEYAAHPVSWQAGYNETALDHHQADGREPIPATTTAEEAATLGEHLGAEIEPIEEEWLPAKVDAVKVGPAMPLLNKFETDVILTLVPDNGLPPFDLNAKLVRHRTRSARRKSS